MGKVGSVLVLGAGIAGVQCALDLADSGYRVYLVEKSPAIGGKMSQLDKTFPTNDCSMCILSPKLVECGRHPNIELLTYSELVDLQGEPGNFKAKVLKRARSVNESICTGCGTCQTKCPTKVPSEFDQGLGLRKAIYVPYAQAVPNIPVIDRDHCLHFQKGKCGVCEKVCPAKAIDYSQVDKELEIDVGAVIIALGYEVFDAGLKPEFGYGIYTNVLTSLEFERMLAASGPFQGEVLRPSDKAHPKRIAWIQCVGSRDKNFNTYCSSVCCMYATKEAIIAGEHLKGVESTIFMIDARAYGKDFDKYYERAKSEYGIRYVRAIPSVSEDPKTKNLILSYVDEKGKLHREEFDLLILSVGFLPPSENKLLSERLNLSLNEHGFCEISETDPLKTSRDGVFVCGAFSGPKDIPETVMEASGAVSKAQALLHEARGTLIEKIELPEEIDVRGIPPRIGVFVCRCGINIASVVDVEEVCKYAATLPFVKHAEVTMFACSQDAQERIKEAIKEHQLNRIVVASCTPRTHQPLFENTIREAGLNRYLFEMANIRDQCSWVHMKEPKEATEKAKDLVRTAVFKAACLEPLATTRFEVTKSALVVGGGLAGMVSALSLADQGFPVSIVEKSPELGGNLRQLYYTVEGTDVQSFLREIIDKVEEHPKIKIFKASKIKNIEGYVGNYETTISLEGGKEEKIKHGVVIVATGALEYKPKEYMYGQDERVLTQRELEEKIGKNEIDLDGEKTVVMIQCVGSRNEERPYCSRYCCIAAVKNALKIKEKNPLARVYVLYREMRTYGFTEDYYVLAREKGIVFVRFEDNRPPDVTLQDKRLIVEVFDATLERKIKLYPDFVVLSTAIVPNPENEELAKMLKVPLNKEGFFLEAHMKLRPVDFATDGVFMCGLAHYPKRINETIAQANAASARAATVLTKDFLESEGRIARVDESKCIFCGLCEANCPFGAVQLDHERQVASVNEALCKGCGACAASCRVGAIDVKGFSDKQLVSMLEVL